jgi:hypothetical protein
MRETAHKGEIIQIARETSKALMREPDREKSHLDHMRKPISKRWSITLTMNQQNDDKVNSEINQESSETNDQWKHSQRTNAFSKQKHHMHPSMNTATSKETHRRTDRNANIHLKK